MISLPKTPGLYALNVWALEARLPGCPNALLEVVDDGRSLHANVLALDVHDFRIPEGSMIIGPRPSSRLWKRWQRNPRRRPGSM
jgi:hypothetical protein